MSIPFAPGAARELLRASTDLLDLIGSAPELITTREIPRPLAGPCITIAAGVNRRENILTSKVRLIVNAWVPKAEVLQDNLQIDTDPEELSWQIATLAGEILDMRHLMGRGPSHTYRGATWRGQWDEGPSTLVDTQRGAENPLYRSVIQVVMKMTTAP